MPDTKPKSKHSLAMMTLFFFMATFCDLTKVQACISAGESSHLSNKNVIFEMSFFSDGKLLHNSHEQYTPSTDDVKLNIKNKKTDIVKQKDIIKECFNKFSYVNSFEYLNCY